MSKSKYIKVTPKGEKKGRVVLASLKPFFLSQGAKIEEPTPEEIALEFPETAEAEKQQTAKQAEAQIAELNETIKSKDENIAELESKITGLEASIKESDELIAKLKGEIATLKKKGE